MLLRSITKHVKDQNWFAVALDFCIVVAGILIAFQITEWNAERQRSAQEREVLVNILEDVESDRVELTSGLEMAAINIDAANYALTQSGLPELKSVTMPVSGITAIEGFVLPVSVPRNFSSEQKSRLWPLSIVRFHPTQASTAFKTLVADGDLSILSNADLIQELQQYSQLWVSLESSQNRSYRPFRDQALFVGQEFGLSPFTEMAEPEFFDILAAEAKLASALRTILEYGVIHQSQMKVVDQKATDLIQMLEAELR